MPASIKKLILSFLAFLVLFSSLGNLFVVQAATPASPPPALWYSQDFKTWLSKVDDPSNPSEIFGERYTSAQVEWVIYGLFAFFINHLTPPGTASTCVNGQIIDCISGIKNVFKSASLPHSNQNIAELIFQDRPLSGISYLRHIADNFSLIPVAHAQGVGFTALSAVQNLWSAFRNIAYGLFVIASITLAFMIMFRVKISPQVVISVQSAIPKIIIALILVTFSYAIAGLFVDLMYVVIGLISLVMAPVIPNASLLTGQSTFSPTDVFNLLTVGGTSSGPLSIAGGVFGLFAMFLTPTILFILVITIILFFVTGPAGVIFGILGLLLMLVVIVIMIVMTVKTVFALFKAFANIVLLTIFAPLYLTAGIVIPSFGFGQWARSYFSHLAVFITTGLLWLLAEIFMIEAWVGSGQGTSLTIGQGFINGNPWPPLISVGALGLGTFIVYTGVSIVLFTLIPKATEVVQGAISGKQFAYGTAIGEALGPVSGPAKFAGGIAVREAGLPAMGAFANALIQRYGISEEGVVGSALYGVARQAKTLRAKQGAEDQEIPEFGGGGRRR